MMAYSGHYYDKKARLYELSKDYFLRLKAAGRDGKEFPEARDYWRAYVCDTGFNFGAFIAAVNELHPGLLIFVSGDVAPEAAAWFREQNNTTHTQEGSPPS